jgi:hypothetical protein
MLIDQANGIDANPDGDGVAAAWKARCPSTRRRSCERGAQGRALIRASAAATSSAQHGDSSICIRRETIGKGAA